MRAKNLLLLVFILIGATGVNVSAGEFVLKPSLSLSEEYTDNVYQSHLLKKDDFITRIMPGIAGTYVAPLWQWNLNYYYDYRYYAKLNDTEDTHFLNGSGLINVIDNLFYVSVSDTYQRVSLDVTRDTTIEGLLSESQSDSNSFSVSPYFLLLSDEENLVKAGYVYSNIWYKSPDAIDKYSHSGFLSVKHQITSRFSFIGDYFYTRQIGGGIESDLHKVLAGFNYEYAENSNIYAQGGYGWYDSGISRFSKPFWNAGLKHSFDIYELNVLTTTVYGEDPTQSTSLNNNYSISLTAKWPKNTSTVGFKVGELIDTSTDTLSSRTYTGTFNTTQQLTPNMDGSLSSFYDYIDIKYNYTYTTRFLISPALDYRLPYDINVRLLYQYLTLYSPGIPEDNKDINRVILELRKTF